MLVPAFSGTLPIFEGFKKKTISSALACSNLVIEEKFIPQVMTLTVMDARLFDFFFFFPF